jgi:prevent-host-death family protein
MCTQLTQTEETFMPVTTIGSREARQKWRDLLDAAYAGTTDTVIERNGKPVAALISYEDYQAVEDTLDELRAARRAAELYEAARRSPALGRSYTKIRAELEDKGLLDE